jgi:PAS domain-containing protein
MALSVETLTWDCRSPEVIARFWAGVLGYGMGMMWQNVVVQFKRDGQLMESVLVGGVGVDITERRRVEAALQEQNEALERANATLEKRVRDRTEEPLCEFYAAAIRRLMHLFNIHVDVDTDRCRATGGSWSSSSRTRTSTGSARPTGSRSTGGWSP